RSDRDLSSDVCSSDLLGFVYSQLGKLDQAVTASRAAVRKAPGALVGYQNLFVIYLQSKQPQEALKILDEAGRQPRLDAEFLIGRSEERRVGEECECGS